MLATAPYYAYLRAVGRLPRDESVEGRRFWRPPVAAARPRHQGVPSDRPPAHRVLPGGDLLDGESLMVASVILKVPIHSRHSAPL